MNGPKKAAAGDKLTKRAREQLAQLRRVRLDDVQVEVDAKAPGDRGQHVCITCGRVFLNNMEASGHSAAHKLAWFSFETGRVEQA